MFPDISEFQGAVDWGALGAAYRAGQIEAIAIRAGFGTVRADHQFAANQAGARAHGIPAIYYWFNYPTFNTPQAEAAMFNSVVGPLGPAEAMCGDFEDDGASGSVFPRGQAGVDWAKAFLTAVEAPQNATWWYTYPFLLTVIPFSQLFGIWPFWLADYSTARDSAFTVPIARQFTDCGSTPGVGGCCDQSRVLKAPLSQWLTPVPPPVPPPPIRSEETMVIRNPADGAVYVVDAAGARHIGGAEYAAWKQTPGYAEIPVDAATVAEIPMVGAPPPVDVNALATALATHPLTATLSDAERDAVATHVLQHLSKDTAPG